MTLVFSVTITLEEEVKEGRKACDGEKEFMMYNVIKVIISSSVKSLNKSSTQRDRLDELNIVIYKPNAII